MNHVLTVLAVDNMIITFSGGRAADILELNQENELGWTEHTHEIMSPL